MAAKKKKAAKGGGAKKHPKKSGSKPKLSAAALKKRNEKAARTRRKNEREKEELKAKRARARKRAESKKGGGAKKAKKKGGAKKAKKSSAKKGGAKKKKAKKGKGKSAREEMREMMEAYEAKKGGKKKPKKAKAKKKAAKKKAAPARACPPSPKARKKALEREAAKFASKLRSATSRKNTEIQTLQKKLQKAQDRAAAIKAGEGKKHKKKKGGSKKSSKKSGKHFARAFNPIETWGQAGAAGLGILAGALATLLGDRIVVTHALGTGNVDHPAQGQLYNADAVSAPIWSSWKRLAVAGADLIVPFGASMATKKHPKTQTFFQSWFLASLALIGGKALLDTSAMIFNKGPKGARMFAPEITAKNALGISKAQQLPAYTLVPGGSGPAPGGNTNAAGGINPTPGGGMIGAVDAAGNPAPPGGPTYVPPPMNAGGPTYVAPSTTPAPQNQPAGSPPVAYQPPSQQQPPQTNPSNQDGAPACADWVDDGSDKGMGDGDADGPFNSMTS